MLLLFLNCLNCFTEEPPSTGSEIEKQLLEAARSGDMEVVKVLISSNLVSRNVQSELFTIEAYNGCQCVYCCLFCFCLRGFSVTEC